MYLTSSFQTLTLSLRAAAILTICIPLAASVASATAARVLATAPGVSIPELLERTPNVAVRRLEGCYTIRVGDATSEPLYVVDGEQLLTRMDGEIPGLLRSDIKRVQVLEARHAVAFGGAGVNGVVLITTRRASAGAAHPIPRGRMMDRMTGWGGPPAREP